MEIQLKLKLMPKEQKSSPTDLKDQPDPRDSKDQPDPKDSRDLPYLKVSKDLRGDKETWEEISRDKTHWKELKTQSKLENSCNH